jgi:cytochrome c oxidase subunit 2
MANMSKRRLLTGAAGTVGLCVLGGLVRAQPDARVIKVVARKFEYEPAVIQLVKGEPVIFELSSLDVTMGFNVPDFHVRSDMLPDKTTTLRFTPDKVGTFDFYCDVFCGSGHEEMEGSIVVS